MNLVKELEKKKSSPKLENECALLKEQIEFLTMRMKEIEGKYKNKLEQKDMIIKKLDESLVEYESKLNSTSR
jgi:hypothetical protein